VHEIVTVHQFPEEMDAFVECETATKTVITMIYDTKHNNQSAQRHDLHHGNCILTENEEEYLIQLCKILSYGGHGLDLDQIIECMNVIAPPINKTTHSESTTHNFLKQHPNIKLSSSSSIDPACAAQVNDNIWEDYFCKLDAYINVLYKMGRLKWKSFAEIPAKNIYNMDEVGSDMTKQ
jgi:hypothetical protein